MSLNTRIRGLQIKDGDVGATQLGTDAVETAKIKNLNVTLGKLETSVQTSLGLADSAMQSISAGQVDETALNASVAGVGLSGGGGSALAVDLNELPAEATFAPGADYIGIVDAGDSGSDKTLWSVIATAIAGSGLTATAGVLSADAVSDNLIEADVLFEDESANCNGSSVAFTLASTPVANSVQVFLNGLLQQVGSGKDYTLSGTTVTFATAPASDDILLIHYIRND